MKTFGGSFLALLGLAITFASATGPPTYAGNGYIPPITPKVNVYTPKPPSSSSSPPTPPSSYSPPPSAGSLPLPSTGSSGTATAPVIAPPAGLTPPPSSGTTTPKSPTSSSTTPPTVTNPDRDTTFPACDNDVKDEQMDDRFGVGLKWQTTDDPNFYTAPGKSACGYNYTDQSNVVCIAPGWVHSANTDHCSSWVQVYLPETGITTQGIVWDVCGAVENTTFGCNDMYLSKQMFEQLAGKSANDSIAAGRLPGHVQWRFIEEPCWGCYAGLPGTYANGTTDTCSGLDQQGFLRCGNMTADNRIVGPSASLVCNQDIKTCDQAAKVAAPLPKLHSSQTAFNQPPPPARKKRSFTA